MVLLGKPTILGVAPIMVYYHPQILTRTWNLMAIQLFFKMAVSIIWMNQIFTREMVV